MTLDLAPFFFRVKAARDTNQCLDYAADVEVLLGEIQRLQSGYDAMLDAQFTVYRKATVGVGVSYREMQDAGVLYRGVTLAVDAFEQGSR